MKNTTFAGDQKVGRSLLSVFESYILSKWVAKIPPQVETYHLTLLTIVWSLGVILFSYLAKDHIAWMWATSIMIILQYVTDLFDGAVGRYRNTGLIKWGFYMDHFLDYMFLGAILTGYSFLVDNNFIYLLFFTITIVGGYMVNSFLQFSVTNEFKISYLFIGPTEIRLLFVIINTLLIIFGKTHLGGILPFVLVFCLIGLIVIVYHTQQQIWKIDMMNKSDQKKILLPPSVLNFMYYLRNKLRKGIYSLRRK